MLVQFITHIETNFPFLKKKRLLLACSGGLDSVVLLHVCAQLDLDITLAHCNFNLRGEESDGDESLVRKLAAQFKVPIKVKSFDTVHYMKDHKGSVQMVARELRYTWFDEIAHKEGFDYVLTAHHADDSLETFLINLSRGTGIGGLIGIPLQNGKVLRPLLHFSKETILEYAKTEHVVWREDSSNTENKYLRNKVRNEIIPKLKELNPSFLANYGKTQGHLLQTSILTQKHMDGLRNEIFEKFGDHYKINIEHLEHLHPVDAYLYELFKGFGFTEWNDIKGLLTALSGKEVTSKTHRLIKDRDYLLLTKKADLGERVFHISEKDKQISMPIQLKLEATKTLEIISKNVIFLDKEKLNYPLVLRKWEKGDYFYPFGMKGKKKLSKFFKDEKMDTLSKEKQWLLCSDNSIVWVIGKRLDERFKVGSDTKHILKITFSV